MTTHQERAGKMGYATPAPKAAKPPSAPIKSLHDGLDRPLSSYYDRREARLRNDAEGLRIARQERAQVATFARARGITAEHLHEALAVMHERDEYPRSKASIDKLRPQTVESLRLELGGAEQANAHLKRYLSVTTALANEVPTLAARANATGAGEDPRIINALAHYGEATQEK